MLDPALGFRLDHSPPSLPAPSSVTLHFLYGVNSDTGAMGPPLPVDFPLPEAYGPGGEPRGGGVEALTFDGLKATKRPCLILTPHHLATLVRPNTAPQGIPDPGAPAAARCLARVASLAEKARASVAAAWKEAQAATVAAAQALGAELKEGGLMSMAPLSGAQVVDDGFCGSKDGTRLPRSYPAATATDLRRAAVTTCLFLWFIFCQRLRCITFRVRRVYV